MNSEKGWNRFKNLKNNLPNRRAIYGALTVIAFFSRSPLADIYYVAYYPITSAKAKRVSSTDFDVLPSVMMRF